MTQSIVEIPIGYYGQFNQGRPLFNADIFVGIPDLDPEIPANQKQVTLLLEDGTEIPVSQPVNTGPGGYISHNGSPATMFVEGNYSIKCLNSLGAQEYYFENVFNKPASSGEPASRVDVVADMITTNFSIGEFVDTSGYTTTGDGGDNAYEIVAGATGVDDGGSFIDLNNGNQAKALFPGGVVNPIQFGAVRGVGFDSTAFFVACDAFSDFTVTPGRYLLTSITFTNDIDIIEGAILETDATHTFDFTGSKFDPGEYQVFNITAASNVTGLKSAKISWFGATGDGVTDDQVNVASVDEMAVGAEVDLLGNTYLLGSGNIPTKNKYVNGYWLINDFDENAPVRLPALETLERHSLLIDSGARYSSWPQDNCSFWNGQLVVAYNEGTGHQSDDKHVVLATSTDGGKSFSLREQPFASSLGMRVSHAGGIIDGQEFYVVREGPGGSLSELKSRRRYQSDFYTDIIESVSASSDYRVLQPDHGMKPGQDFKITGANNVGGQDPNGTQTVDSVQSSSEYRFSGIGAAASSETGGGTFRLENLQSDFTDIDPGGSAFSTAVVAADPNIVAAPNLFHSMGYESTEATQYASLYFGYSGGGATNVSICKVRAANRAVPTIDWARQIDSALTQGSEPSVVHDPISGDLMGFIRSEGTGYPIRFWRSTDELATDATITDCPWGNDFATESPIPCRIIGDELFFVLTGTRTRDGTAGNVGLYMGRVLVTEATDPDIWTNTKNLLFLKNIFFSATNQTASSNAVGVPSMAVIDDNTLAIMYSTENSPLLFDSDGQPSVETIVMRVNESYNTGIGYDDGTLMTQYTEKTELLSVNRINSASTFAFSGDFESNGTTVISNGLAVTETGTGVYSATFVDENGSPLELSSIRYMPFIQVSSPASPGNAWDDVETGKTTTGFTYELRDSTTDALDSQSHSIGVVWFEDYTREEWQP